MRTGASQAKDAKTVVGFLNKKRLVVEAAQVTAPGAI